MEIFSKLFKPELVLDDPDTAPLPTEISQMFALNGALINLSKYDFDTTETNIDTIIRYMKRLPGHMADFMDKFILDVVRKHCGNDKDQKRKMIQGVSAIAQWVIDPKNRELWTNSNNGIQ
jgi:hypothetical protein